ncbi:MAG: hypothetical protein AB1349_11015 [Elusimicrobiota bacterium]
MKRIILIVILVFGIKYCFGHGVEYSVIKGGVGIKVYYSDGTPMSYSEVKIFSPQDRQTEFQTGVTDKNGCFVFYPDSIGKWKIEVNDGMGHGIVKEIDITEGLTTKPEITHYLPIWKKILIGISFIFGLTGILFYIVTNKKIKKGQIE